MAFSNLELSILGEIGNVSVGGAATSLSDFVNKLVTISIPKTQITTTKRIREEFPIPMYVKIDYTGELEGSNLLMIDKEQGLEFTKIIAKEKIGMEIDEWGELSENVLKEVFNIMAGHMANSMEIIFKKEVRIKPPEFEDGDAKDAFGTEENETVVLVSFDIKVEGEIKIKMVNVIKKEQAEIMINLIAGGFKL